MRPSGRRPEQGGAKFRDCTYQEVEATQIRRERIRARDSESRVEGEREEVAVEGQVSSGLDGVLRRVFGGTGKIEGSVEGVCRGNWRRHTASAVGLSHVTPSLAAMLRRRCQLDDDRRPAPRPTTASTSTPTMLRQSIVRGVRPFSSSVRVLADGDIAKGGVQGYASLPLLQLGQANDTSQETRSPSASRSRRPSTSASRSCPSKTTARSCRSILQTLTRDPPGSRRSRRSSRPRRRTSRTSWTTCAFRSCPCSQLELTQQQQ